MNSQSKSFLPINRVLRVGYFNLLFHTHRMGFVYCEKYQAREAGICPLLMVLDISSRPLLSFETSAKYCIICVVQSHPLPSIHSSLYA